MPSCIDLYSLCRVLSCCVRRAISVAVNRGLDNASNNSTSPASHGSSVCSGNAIGSMRLRFNGSYLACRQ